jgi:putative transposase
MPRIARIVLPGLPHHVTQRGNRGDRVFTSIAERMHYLECLARYLPVYSVELFAYCLMPNHVHLIVSPGEEDSLGRSMRDAHTAYSAYFNKRHEVTGHLWQNRFYSCPLDEQHFYAALRYVEMNPVRAGMVDVPEAFRWSSARAHCGVSSSSLLLAALPDDFPVGAGWTGFLLAEELRETGEIRSKTRSGLPCGCPRSG